MNWPRLVTAKTILRWTPEKKTKMTKDNMEKNCAGEVTENAPQLGSKLAADRQKWRCLVPALYGSKLKED